MMSASITWSPADELPHPAASIDEWVFAAWAPEVLAVISGRNVAAAEADGSGVGRDSPGDLVNQGRLAGAERTGEQGRGSAWVDRDA